MNEQNVDFLSRQIKFTGFGEEHAPDLKAKMVSGASEFVLSHLQDFGKDKAEATLHFRKSEQSDLYFFNNYELSVKNPQKEDGLKQTFYINPKEDNITLKEGYNLLSGRAIQKEYTPKEGQKYNAWMQLDFKETDKNGQFKLKQFHPNYGYDLEASLHKHPIQELATNEGIKRLLESLERGNRQQVTYGETGNERKLFIEASPQFKSVNVYDESMKRILTNNLKAETNHLAAKEQKIPEQAVTVSKLGKDEKVKSVDAVSEQKAPKTKRQRIPR